MSIVIADYDVGNLRSVQKGLEKVGAGAVISRDAGKIAGAGALVLPGVGAFPECMKNLRRFGLLGVVRDYLQTGRPFLGICVGYQLLFGESLEFGHSVGIGAIKGKCVPFEADTTPGKIPHMGWNQVRYTRPGRLFKGIPDGSEFYFVHSYYPVPDEDVTVAETEYGVKFAASIERGNIFATQFHPEKSQAAGLKALENFSKLVR